MCSALFFPKFHFIIIIIFFLIPFWKFRPMKYVFSLLNLVKFLPNSVFH